MVPSLEWLLQIFILQAVNYFKEKKMKLGSKGTLNV